MTKSELLQIAKPILFNTDMVQRILSGNKSSTRRICKDGNIFTVPDMGFYDRRKRTYAVHNYADKDHTEKLSLVERTCPFCIGDIMYVRETWNTYCDGCLSKDLEEVLGSTCAHSCGENSNGYYYKATDINHKGWKPSIFMPKEAARIFLKVKDVRVERLQAMTLDDFLKEGVSIRPEAFNDPDNAYWQARSEFVKIWDSTIKKKEIYLYGWDGNPWVWVIEFERCTKPDGE